MREIYYNTSRKATKKKKRKSKGKTEREREKQTCDDRRWRSWRRCVVQRYELTMTATTTTTTIYAKRRQRTVGEMRGGAQWGELCVKVSRAPSKLAAVSNWKTSRRSCMCVRLFVFVSSVCVCVCVCTCVFVALSREIKSGITISRSIAWVIEPHSRMSHCALPQIQSVSKVFPKGFFPTPEK